MGKCGFLANLQVQQCSRGTGDLTLSVENALDGQEGRNPCCCCGLECLSRRSFANSIRSFANNFRSYSEPLDLQSPTIAPSASFALLARFEQEIQKALSNHLSCEESRQFLAVIEDLVWALLQPVAADGTRLLHCLQTEAFPTPRGWRMPMEAYPLCRASLAGRQALLAVIACLLQPEEFASLAHGSCYLRSPARHSAFLDLLGVQQAELLLSRAHRWPAEFENEMLFHAFTP